MQTRRRSAVGCCSAEITRAIVNGESAFALSSMCSTSSPIMVSLSASFSTGSSVSRCSFSQERVNFMMLPCDRRKLRPDENARTSASCLRRTFPAVQNIDDEHCANEKGCDRLHLLHTQRP